MEEQEAHVSIIGDERGTITERWVNGRVVRWAGGGGVCCAVRAATPPLSCPSSSWPFAADEKFISLKTTVH